jgi:hypothetical protein
MVTAMDDAVGACLAAVRDEGLERDALVVFLSDNGGPKDNASSNAPLRGTKRTVYEGGNRVFHSRCGGRVNCRRELCSTIRLFRSTSYPRRWRRRE